MFLPPDILLKCGATRTGSNGSNPPSTPNPSLANSQSATPLRFGSTSDQHQASSSLVPGSQSTTNNNHLSGLYANGLCRWPGCETICDGQDAFSRHLSDAHPPDEKAAAQTCVQAQIVTQLEEQLSRERRRFDAMMNYLQLTKTTTGTSNALSNSGQANATLSLLNSLKPSSLQTSQLSNFLPGSSTATLNNNSTSSPSSAIAAAANILAAAASAVGGSGASGGSTPLTSFASLTNQTVGLMQHASSLSSNVNLNDSSDTSTYRQPCLSGNF